MHASIFSVNWFCSKSDVSPYNALGAHHAGTGGGGGGRTHTVLAKPIFFIVLASPPAGVQKGG